MGSVAVFRKDGERARRGLLVWVALASIALSSISLAPGTGCADDEPVSWGYTLAHELMSPFCPGRTLAQCTSPQAAELRQWIVFQAAAGASREEVEATLIERYGDVILQKPKAEGWGLSVYVIPVVAVALGAVVVVLLLQRLVGGPKDSQGLPASGSSRGADVPLRAAPSALAEDEEKELERIVDAELGELR